MSTEKLPPILYHYTSQKGLLGIIKSKEIWATDIFYLNDTMEFKYAVDLTSKILKEYLDSHTDTYRNMLLDELTEGNLSDTSALNDSHESPPKKLNINELEFKMIDNLFKVIRGFEQFHFFVFSLSEKGDLLSQWRGYCPQDNGYSIGFKTSVLGKLMEKKDLRFVKCIYEKDEQARIINDFIGKYVKDLRSKFNELSNSESMRKSLTIDYLISFFTIASKLKDESFIEEEEWRIVSKPQNEGQHVKFRKGTSTIIPHIRIGIDDSGYMPIEEVIISPTFHKQLSNNAVNFLLSCEGIKSCSVKNSKIPYRAQ